MSEEEIIKYIKDEIESDKDTMSWFEDNNNATRKGIEECIEAHQGLLDLYQKEKEKNKEYENKIKSVLELIDTKPYTAYTLYGDILYEDENIRELLEESH